MDYIPQAISAAMLAGILLRFGLDAFASLQLNFPLSAGMGWPICSAAVISRATPSC